jgi:hypothetical protein
MHDCAPLLQAVALERQATHALSYDRSSMRGTWPLSRERGGRVSTKGRTEEFVELHSTFCTSGGLLIATVAESRIYVYNTSCRCSAVALTHWFEYNGRYVQHTATCSLLEFLNTADMKYKGPNASALQ